MTSTRKATLFVGAIGILGAWMCAVFAPLTQELLPHAIFLAVLLLNTFFSIRFFANIQPNDRAQMLMDIALAIIYILLALTLGHPISFALSALALFILSPAKYALMLEVIPHTKLLKKKILINLLGAGACTLLLTSAFFEYPLFGAWAFATAFALANVYLLYVNPMYRLPDTK
jgi:hypothetical protein